MLSAAIAMAAPMRARLTTAAAIGSAFPCPLRMIAVRGLDCEPEANRDNTRTDDVAQGFDAVSDEGERVPDDAGRAFHRRQCKIYADAKKRRSDSPLYRDFWLFHRSCRTLLLRG